MKVITYNEFIKESKITFGDNEINHVSDDGYNLDINSGSIDISEDYARKIIVDSILYTREKQSAIPDITTQFIRLEDDLEEPEHKNWVKLSLIELLGKMYSEAKNLPEYEDDEDKDTLPERAKRR